MPEKASEAADSESNVLEKHIDSNTSQDNQVPISLDETQESDYNHEAIGSISKQDSDSENHSPFPKQNDGADDVNPKYQNNHNYSKEQTYSTLSSQITIKTQVQSSLSLRTNLKQKLLLPESKTNLLILVTQNRRKMWTVTKLWTSLSL